MSYRSPEDHMSAVGGTTEIPRNDPGTQAFSGSDDGVRWEDPIDFLADDLLTGVPELRAEHLPAAIYPFVVDTAARMGADPASVALAAIVAASSVADDKWRLQPKQYDDTWTEAPRLWGAIVGDPSVRKTPIISACTLPLDALDAEARQRHAEDVKLYERQMAEWKDKGSDLETKPRFPPLDRFLVEGTTIEALSEVLRTDADAKYRAPAHKVLIRQDELAEFFAGFDRYRNGGRGGSDRGAYLRLYNGGRYTIDRIGRGSFAILNWSASMLGGVQPGPIQRIAREADDDGLLARLLYAVASQQTAGLDRRPDREALQRYQALFPALAALHPATLQGAHAGAAVVVLHADAHRHRMMIEDLARSMSAMPDTSNRLKAAFGKWPGLFARIALTFHLIEIADCRARGASQPVLDVLSEANARSAAHYLRDIILPHLLRADAVMFSTVQAGHARWIAGFILAKGLRRITRRDIVQHYGALKPPEALRELLQVMESLVTMGWLEPEEPTNPTRPPPGWQVNPAIFTKFAGRAEHERIARANTRNEIARAVSQFKAMRSGD